MDKYYVITDEHDPGSEHQSYDEAVEVCRDLRGQGFAEPKIVGPYRSPSASGSLDQEPALYPRLDCG